MSEAREAAVEAAIEAAIEVLRAAPAVRSALGDTSALDRMLAEAWEKGYNTGATDSAVVIGWGVQGADPSERPEPTPNPYAARATDGGEGR